MTTELAIIQETVSLPITVEQAVHDWEEYQALTQRLLNDTDFQVIGRTKFKKKSAWRKYARAFNITDRVTFEEIHRADDGYPLWARIRVQAEAPNGRTAEADHEVHVTERCCPGARGLDCPRQGWSNHRTCCPRGCDGRDHWSHPGDLPATALTRAKNRAIADLIGAGEVSAEEMIGQRRVEDDGPIEGEVVQRKPIASVRKTLQNVDAQGNYVPPSVHDQIRNILIDRAQTWDKDSFDESMERIKADFPYAVREDGKLDIPTLTEDDAKALLLGLA